MSSNFVGLVCYLTASIAIAGTPFANMADINARAGMDRFRETRSQRTIKVAILDNGFKGREAIADLTTYHAGPVAVDPKNEERHGTYMAQIVMGMLDRAPYVQYQLHLFSAFGYSNLKAAVDAVVAGGFDVVLYSQVWEYGGNGDGAGFINTVVNKATAAGVIWINAAGNFGNATYFAPIEILNDSWAFLPSPNQGVRVRCHDNKAGKCNLRAVLSWNDFKNEPEIGTSKDLDLVLSDDTLKVIRTGGLQQVETGGAPGTSLYPREIVEADLQPGLYELRVKARSTNFSKSVDSLRIVTSGDYIEQIDTSDARETLLAPADNASVITVGASDSEKSGASASMGKPEFSIASSVELKNGDSFKGSSNSAAMAAALATVAKAANPSANRQDVLDFMGAGISNDRIRNRAPVRIPPRGSIPGRIPR